MIKFGISSPAINFYPTGEANSYRVVGSGVLPKLDQYTNAVKLSLEGFTETSVDCFEKYTNLINVSFDDKLQKIVNHVFYKTKVQYFRIPKSVSELKSQPFDEEHAMIWISVDPENKNFRDVDGILYSFDMTVLWFYPGDHGESFVSVPNTVKTIQLAAFSTSNIIQYINIPSSVTTIYGYQFLFMYAIEYIEIMNKNESIKFDYTYLLASAKHNSSCIHFVPIPVITKNCQNMFYFSISHPIKLYTVFILM